MQDTNPLTPKVLSATDFSLESERAFYHALAFAVVRRARMTLLHIGPESRKDVTWDRFPGVRETLVSWGLLDAAAPKTDISAKLGLGIKKMAMRDENPRQGLVDYLRKRPTDLLVMATEGRTGLARLHKSSIAESVYELTHSHTLLLPQACRNLVDADTGQILVRTVLAVIDDKPDPRPALATLLEWLPHFTHEKIEVIVLFNGFDEDMPQVMLPSNERLTWQRVIRLGDPLRVILDCIEEFDIDLVALTTQVQRGIYNRLRGSLVDRLIRRSGRAILALPATDLRRR